MRRWLTFARSRKPCMPSSSTSPIVTRWHARQMKSSGCSAEFTSCATTPASGSSARSSKRATTTGTGLSASTSAASSTVCRPSCRACSRTAKAGTSSPPLRCRACSPAIGGIYITTKYALVGYMETLRLELEPHGIGVSVLCPGLVNTAIFEGENSRPARYRNTRFRALAAMSGDVMREQVLPTGMDPMEVGRRVLQRNSSQRPLHPDAPGIRSRACASVSMRSWPHFRPRRRRHGGWPPRSGVLRHPMFAAERDRRLAERRKRSPAKARRKRRRERSQDRAVRKRKKRKPR